MIKVEQAEKDEEWQQSISEADWETSLQSVEHPPAPPSPDSSITSESIPSEEESEKYSIKEVKPEEESIAENI